MSDDLNILVEDGAVAVKLGDKTVSVRGLVIEKSVAWSKSVKSAWFAQAKKSGAVMKIVADETKSEEERVDLIESAMLDGAGEELLMVRDVLMQYNPEAITPEIINSATAQQIVTAFEVLYELENPIKRLRAAIAKA
jgi:hypothetical protein